MNDSCLLPTEIIYLIINQVDETDLKACAFVNKQFYTIAKPLLLWRTVKVSYQNREQILDKIVKAQPPCGQHIRYLDLGSWKTWTNDSLLLLMAHIPLLESLLFRSQWCLTNDSLVQLPRHCPRLRFLEMADIQVTQPFLNALGQHCRQLSKLVLGSSAEHLAPDAFLTAFGPTCALKVLVFRLTTSDTGYESGSDISIDDAYDEYRGRMLEEEAQRLPTFDLTGLDHLTHLTITNGPVGMLERIFLNDSGPHGTSFLPRLTHLTLKQCYRINNEMLVPVLKSTRRLLRLVIIDGNLSNATLQALADHTPNIKQVAIHGNSGICSGGLRYLVRKCRQLSKVSFVGCKILSEDMQEPGENCLDPEDDEYVVRLDQEALRKIRKRPYIF
ncbi:unnamed protein product [Absidia cylindrospora]